MSDDYTPIDCAVYSEYELAIMHRTRLRVHWREEGGDHVAVLVPTDLRTRAGEAYLIAQAPDGESLEIRLDRIRHCTPLEAAT